MAFAENLKLLRKHRKLTQKELADKSGVSCSSIINYENERRTNPPSSVMQKLASALGVSPMVLQAESITFKHNGIIAIKAGFDFTIPRLDIDDWEEFIAERGEQDIILQIAEYIKQLNKEGAAEAVKRVGELTEIEKYKAAVPQSSNKSQIITIRK